MFLRDMTFIVFWGVTLCVLVDRYQHFWGGGGESRLHILLFR
jgi:hypothetical protein